MDRSKNQERKHALESLDSVLETLKEICQGADPEQIESVMDQIVDIMADLKGEILKADLWGIVHKKE